MTRNRKHRRLTAILVAVIMIISCLPASLTAEEGNVSITPWTPPNGILTDYTIVAEDNAQISFDVESGAASVIYIRNMACLTHHSRWQLILSSSSGFSILPVFPLKLPNDDNLAGAIFMPITTPRRIRQIPINEISILVHFPL